MARDGKTPPPGGVFDSLSGRRPGRPGGGGPAPTQQKELERGLRTSVVSLGIISIILALATISAVNQTNRLNRVADVLNQELVAQAAQVQDMSISRDRGGFIIKGLIVNFVENLLTSQQIVELEQDLAEAAGGPVTIDTDMLLIAHCLLAKQTKNRCLCACSIVAATSPSKRHDELRSICICKLFASPLHGQGIWLHSHSPSRQAQYKGLSTRCP